MAQTSPEKGKGAAEHMQRPIIAVEQPHKLGNLLETIELMNTVSERIGESKSHDLGGSGGGIGDGTQAGQQSWRDEAIANLPATTAMQVQLQKHITTEIKHLRKDLRKAAKRAAKSGNAYHLNQMYARIRRLNGMLRELLSASVDVIKRLYIRVFVDKQTVF